MSDNDQKPGKILRTSSGRTRLTASGGSEAEEPKAPESPAPEAPRPDDAPAAPEVAPPKGPAPMPAQASEEGTAGSAPTGSAPASGAEVSGSAEPEATAGSQPQSGSGPATRISSASKGMRLSASGGAGETQVQPAVSGAAPFGSGPSSPQPAPAGPAAGGASGSQQGSSSEGMLPGGVKSSSGGVKMKSKSSKKGPRTVRLTVANIDPWSVMKMAFLLSLAIAIAMLVATLVLWLVLQSTGVIGTVESTMEEIAGAENAEAIVGLIGLGRVMATAFVLALVNIVLMTALSTLFAFLYNLGASIVGGFHLTLTDE